ncbi:MAG: M15 family metallopeptidase [Oscillospiraceae bacterium]|nr:M15 family metallopeptidase [Oscillospiraceae bacterium]
MAKTGLKWTELKNRATPYLRVTGIALLLALLLFGGIRAYTLHTMGDRSHDLILINPWNPLSETGYTPRLTTVEKDIQANRVCAGALKQMLADCREGGRKPLLLEGYRSLDDQLVLYDAKVQEIADAGLSPEEAEREVQRHIAPPGRSEHETGLAFDIVDADYTQLDNAQGSTPVSLWLAENAWRYGFILRYPDGAESITGYDWHPWHYRYVGREAAENIWTLDITLEEYLALFYSNAAQVTVDTPR